MKLYNSPRPCAGGCGTLVEWGLDHERRVGLIEMVSREAHLCPRRLTGAYVQCACGATIHRYADGAVEDVRSKLPHSCTKKPDRAEPPARGAAVASPPALPSPAPSKPPEPTLTLAEQLGL